MSKSALKTIFSFSLVIEFIAIYLFFVTLPSEAGFIPTVISYFAGLITTILSTLSIRKASIEEGYVPKTLLVLSLTIGIEFVLILIRVIILIS